MKPDKGSGEQKKAAPQTITVRGIRSKDYRDIFVWGVYGGERIDFFEAIIQSYGMNAAESQSPQNQARNEIIAEAKDEVNLKMTPRIAKIVHNWLGQHIKSWEDKYGKIEA